MDKTNGALTGAVLAAAASWVRYDDDTQRRLTNVRDDARDALNQVRDWNSRGEVIRSRLPVVMDAQVGIAVANATEPSPVAVPSATTTQRPDITTQMEVAVADMSWPPQPGTYDQRGMVTKVGELTATTLAITFEEVRAWIQGMAQRTAPTTGGKVQVFYAANSLVSVISSLGLKWTDYRDAWLRLFGATASSTGVASHVSTQTPPSVTFTDPGVALLKPLGMPDIMTAFKHNNTDAASKWRLTVGAGNINSSTTVANFSFGTAYSKGGEPYQPVVAINDPRFAVVNVTPVGFQIQNLVQLAASVSYDFGVAVTAGCC